MLRGMVGDERFFAGVRRYYAGLAGRTATTADFQAVLEAESGRELGWFFEQWLEGPGIPRLAAEHAWDGNAREAVVTLRQLQPAEWPAFRLLLELEVVGREGEAVRHRVELTEREQSFRLPAAAPPTSVRVDPDGWVLWEDAGRR
jgi:aminopeptidase N